MRLGNEEIQNLKEVIANAIASHEYELQILKRLHREVDSDLIVTYEVANKILKIISKITLNK